MLLIPTPISVILKEAMSYRAYARVLLQAGPCNSGRPMHMGIACWPSTTAAALAARGDSHHRYVWLCPYETTVCLTRCSHGID